MEKGITYTGLADQHKEELEEKLMSVMDTEIGLDIVNLGLIYGIDLDDDGGCTVRLTFTGAGCSCSEHILKGVHEQLEPLDFVNELKIKIVWSPGWVLDRITRYGRISLGINPGR
ncbi:metal-sulfur cluster biosynthetic enzyme [Trichococcus patagoniensis]|uniref:Metal-sulfur cluster biosynthetic enzyme n=1 Tax=Trichococcus patagoniensis TaxID=382641 RepID=A0A2T5IEL7_9LACT|nr:metal-sulfur cluster assembly factor [Trichococcus patagoniensis]PTQ82221.1 metal-sulfur cluster biosynthetic enzyme [Trichococcus patagoniensis]